MNLLPGILLLMIITAFSALAPSVAEGAGTDHFSILTSYPPEFYQPFLDRYQKLNPAIQIQILNKKTTAALEEILKGNGRKFDLFWSSSLDAFEILKTSEKLKHSDYKLQNHTISIENVRLQDQDGYYFCFALSGVGFMWNESFLKENHLKAPTNWQSLTDPSYYGYIAMSTPSRSGTTHLIVESILQSMGWQEGWAYLLKTAGNFATLTARSFSVPEGIANGRFGIGFVIDFLAYGQKNSNTDIDFRYGQPTLLMPAGIALLENGDRKKEALNFIDFVLSIDGQKLLLDPSINRLPVIAEVYSLEGMNIPELLHLINQQKTRPYDTELSRSRYNVVNNLFDQLITYRLLERRKIWKKLYSLERGGNLDDTYFKVVKDSVMSLISEMPITEQQSLDPKFTAVLFAETEMTGESELKRQLFRQWDEFVTERLTQAQSLLDDISQKMLHSRK